jgi:hypothetical protein
MPHKNMKGVGNGLVGWVFATVIGLAIFSASIGTGLNAIVGFQTNTSILGAAGTTLIGLTGLLVAAALILRLYHSANVGS